MIYSIFIVYIWCINDIVYSINDSLNNLNKKNKSVYVDFI